jgi:uncharacterized protein
MTDNRQDLHPITGPERIDMLDAIRGFALFGILLMNLEAFNGPITGAMSGIDADLHGINRWADGFIYIFVQGKFWTLFSLLFGIGFALMYERAKARGGDFTAVYKRRLWVLLGIGLAHFLLIWEGDILFNYAVAGFVLLWLLKSGRTPGLAAVALLYCVPLALIALLAMVGDGGHGGALAKELAEETLVQGHSGYGAVSAWRWRQFLQSLGSMIVLLPMTVAMFALGVRLHRTGQTRPLPGFESGAMIKAAALWCSGLALMLLSVSIAPEIDPVQVDWISAKVNILNLLAGALMCLGAFLGLRGLWPIARCRKALGAFVPLGRMALSNYLAQSVICTLIFYGYGLGYYQQLPRAWHIPFAMALIALQAFFSAWWLKRFSMGPAEYLWRWLTYGKRPKFVS